MTVVLMGVVVSVGGSGSDDGCNGSGSGGGYCGGNCCGCDFDGGGGEF